MGASSSGLAYDHSSASVDVISVDTSGRVPPSVDLRSNCISSADVGDVSASASFAIVNAYMNMTRARGLTVAIPSRRAVFTASESAAGDNLMRACAALNAGVCSEEEWPFHITERMSAPSCVGLHLELKGIPQEEDALTHWIAAGNCLVCAVKVGESGMQDGQWTEDDDWVGTICVCILGYNMYERTFIAQMPFGTRYGENGFQRIPFAYICNRDLTTDVFAVLPKTTTDEGPLFVR